MGKNMDDIKRIFEFWATEESEHPDVTKCGQCWQTHLRSEVAKEFLQAGRTAESDVKDMYSEIDRRWRETSLFKEVQDLMKTGKTITEIAEIMTAKGIEI